jgi:autotransporter passenger strand-loop-strand repeat protein
MTGVYRTVFGQTFESPKDFVLDSYPMIDHTNPDMPVPYSNADLAQIYSNSLPDIMSGALNSRQLSGDVNFVLNKLDNPFSSDIGPGNINFGSASTQLLSYLNNPAYAGDPLNLQQYLLDPSAAANGPIGPTDINFTQFHSDLLSLDSPATAAIATLDVTQGFQRYTNAFGSAFTDLAINDPQQQAALLAAYYKQGDNLFASGSSAMLNPLNLPGGQFALNNYGTFDQILNINGPQPPVPLTLPQELGQILSTAGTAIWDGAKSFGTYILDSTGSIVSPAGATTLDAGASATFDERFNAVNTGAAGTSFIDMMNSYPVTNPDTVASTQTAWPAPNFEPPPWPGDQPAPNAAWPLPNSEFLPWPSEAGLATIDPNAGATTIDPNAGATTIDPIAFNPNPLATIDPNAGATTIDPIAFNPNPISTFDPFAVGGTSGFGFSPVVLDLTGNGIKITQLSSSDTYFDVTGSGEQNLTAWAGAGNGVLFFDPTGAGQLTQANQVIFTDWDPSATSDMQALLDVFDTNHDGALDAGDTNFANFFVMVTNADGTQTARSLASLGITSINLNQDATNIALPDGSSINGETTFTTSSGSGTAATVTFAADPFGHVVTSTTTTNADGSTTIVNTADNSDGSVVYQRILNTLITSSVSSGITTTTTNKTLSTVNNGGVVMTLQTDVIAASTNGVTSETLTNYRGGAITSTGELTSSGTSGSEKLNATTTTTTVSSGGTVVTILRDQLGGGWTTQKEVDTTTSAGGSASYVISNLNPDGTASDVMSSTVTNGGLTRTTTDLIDGSAAMATTTVDATVVSGATRTETVTHSAGTTVTSLITTVTQTTSNTVTRTTSSDLTDGTTLNLTTVAQTVTSSGGAATTTQTDSSANGTLLDKTVTTNTPQSSGGLVTSAVTSALDNGAFIVVGSQTTTISNAGGSKTTTVVNDSANGTLLSESIVSATLGSAARSVTIYANGDGKVSQSETVTVNSGTTTDTVQNLNGDGSLVNEAVTTTTSGGLARTIQVDSTGAGTPGAPVFDHITSDTTTTSAGTSTETVTHYGASTANKIDQTQTVVSANGLTTTVYRDFTGSGFVADGTWDQITTDQTVVNPDGSLNETVTTTDGAGHTLETTQKSTSADRRTITTTTTLGTTNLVKAVETVTTASNGTVTDQVVHFDQLGDVIGATVTTMSADGLVKTIQNDIQGQSAAVYTSSGLAFDRTTTDTTVINADGSRTETANVTSQNGTLLSTTSAVTSPNGLSVTTTANPFATAHYATKTTDVTTLNADGSRTETMSDYNFNQALIDQTQMITSAGGLSSTVLHDFNGDGVTDQSTTDATTINADGTRTEVVTDYTGGTNGTVRDVTTIQSGIIVTSAGLKTVITRQSNGSVPTYQTETITPSANGTVTDTTQYYATSGGPLLLMTTATTSANGLTRTIATAVNGDTTTDFSTTDSIVLNADGSQTETVTNSNRAGLISETVTKTYANGLSTITQVDANGAVNGLGAPIFNRVTTDNTVLNASDGSRTRTITTTNTNGATIEQTVTNTSADQQTITISRYLNETGTIATVDQSETVQTQTNGSVVDTITSYNGAHALLGTITKTTSGNGLSVQTVYQNAAGTTVDTQSETTTFDTNGDGGNLLDCEDTDVINSTTTLKSSVKTQTSGNGQTKTITMALSGALAGTIAPSFNAAANESISIADTGVTTQTITDTINSSPTTGDTTTIVTSADKLTTTTSTTLGSSALPYIVAIKSIATDGSTSDQTTYYDPADLSFIVQQYNASVSYDGRTITTTDYVDYDGTQYNVVTDTVVKNADNTTTETRSGSGSFGAPAFSKIVHTLINADASTTTTTTNYDGTGLFTGQIVADVSANGLVKSFAYDTTGLESTANLNAAAIDILTGTAPPASMLPTDIIGSDVTTLNADGSKTEIIKTAYGNSFSNLRSQTTTTTSANGLVTVTRIDNNGNGVFNQIDTTTIAPDGSKTSVSNVYGDTSATANTLIGSNTYTVSANGLITTLATSTGITDVTVTFPHSNGSYEWSRTVAPNSPAAYYGAGYQPGSASHFIDANGIDTWTVNNGYGDPSRTITIDLATEKQDIAIANEIYRTVLGHPMDDAETQYLNYFITNGILSRNGLAYSLITNTQEYNVNYGISVVQNGTAGYLYYGFDVMAAFENALGRLPTAEEMATFDQYMESNAPTAQALASMAVAVAQYAADLGQGNNRTSIDPNQDLISTAPQWISPAANAVQITTSGTYSYSGQWLTDGNPATGLGAVTLTVNGNNNVILAYNGSVVTVSGFNNSIDLPSTSATVNASNTAIMVENGGIGIVSGNNDQIAQVGPTELILSSGTSDEIDVGAGTLLSGHPWINSWTITSASNATVVYGANVGAFTNPAGMYGNNDTVRVGSNSYVDVIGTGDVVNVTAGGFVALFGTANGSVVSSGGELQVESGSVASNTTVLSGGVLDLWGGAVVSGLTVSAGGIVLVDSGYAQNNYTIGSGVTVDVASGGSVSGTVVSSGGELILYGGSVANGTTFLSGSLEEIAFGNSITNYVTSANVILQVGTSGTVGGATVTSGTELDVLNGGVVSNAIVNSSGNLYVEGVVSGATVSAGGNATVLQGGFLEVQAGQTVRGVSVSSGGKLFVLSGGTASNTVVSSGGALDLMGGAIAGGTTIQTGGILITDSGFTETNFVVSSGLMLEVGSAGTASNTTVLSGGVLDLWGGAIVGGTTTISAGGTLIVDSGYTQNNYTVSSGVILEVAPGGTASNVTVSSGGELLDYGGTVNGVTALSGGVFVSGGGTLNVLSGQTVSGASVYGSGTLVVSSGGIASNTTVNDGGHLTVLGTANGAVVALAGSATVSGGTLNVLSGQTDWNISVASAGTLVVSSGGTVSNTTVSSGGHLTVNGTVVGATVSNGGAIISSGGVLDTYGQSVTGVTVSSGGTLIVDYGGTASNLTVSSGGKLTIYGSWVSGATISSGATTLVSGLSGELDVLSGQTVRGVSVVDNAFLVVSSGGIASSATVSSGGILYLLGGAVVSGTTTVSSGGIVEVASGYTQRNYIVGSATTLEIASAGIASSTIVSSGGTLELLSGGTANATTFSAGSFMEIAGGYSMSTYVTSANVALEVASGGTVSSATVVSGTTLDVLYGGVVSTITVSTGGNLVIDGTVSAATVSAGGNVTVGAWGTLDVTSGQTVLGVSVSSGGTQNVISGTASGTTVGSGGREYVFSGGVDSGTTLNGGTEIVSAGGVVNGTITFGANGGLLVLEQSTGFAGRLGGFATSADQLDLADIAFDSSTTVSFVEATGNTSGTLTVSDGVHSAVITVLGNHVTSNFIAASDGNGGTLITDPPTPEQAAAGTGGAANILSGGTANGATVESHPPAIQQPSVILAGGAASGTTAHSPGQVEVPSGNVVNGATLDNGSGTAVTSTTVSSASLQGTSATASDTTVGNGGQVVASSGTANGGTAINTSGNEIVSSGAANCAATNGEDAEVGSGNSASGGTATSLSGGKLTLASSIDFGDMITGIDRRHLADIAFDSNATLGFSEEADDFGGALATSDALHTADLTLLSQFVAAQFAPAGDGHGGTLTGDPAAGAGPVMLSVNPGTQHVSHA